MMLKAYQINKVMMIRVTYPILCSDKDVKNIVQCRPLWKFLLKKNSYNIGGILKLHCLHQN